VVARALKTGIVPLVFGLALGATVHARAEGRFSDPITEPAVGNRGLVPDVSRAALGADGTKVLWALAR
jgi:hypothetical protein